MTTIAANIQQVRERMARACALAHRPVESVTLLTVSKTYSADAVREAVAAGERRFGENYVQEGIDKIGALIDLRGGLEWHLIGPLQSNKTRVVASQFDWVHTVDRLKIAERLSAQRPPELPPLQVCLQVPSRPTILQRNAEPIGPFATSSTAFVPMASSSTRCRWA